MGFRAGRMAGGGALSIDVGLMDLGSLGSDARINGATESGSGSRGSATGGGSGGIVNSRRAWGAGGASETGAPGRVRSPLSVGSEPRSTGGMTMRWAAASGLSAAKPARVKTAAVETIRIHIDLTHPNLPGAVG